MHAGDSWAAVAAVCARRRALPEVISVGSPPTWAPLSPRRLRALTLERDGMSVVVVVPDEMADAISAALDDAGIGPRAGGRLGLDAQVTVVPISLAKGLEVDGVVVVEPSRIVASEVQGLRAPTSPSPARPSA